MLRALVGYFYRHSVGHWLMRRRHRGVRFGPTVEWRGDGTVAVAPGVVVGANSVIAVGPGCALELGRGVWLGRDCEISAGTKMCVGERSSLQHRTQLHGDVSIGSGCVGAANLYVSSAAHEFRMAPELPIRVQDFHRLRRPAGTSSRPVSIGDDCWLGINVVVAPGVTIGRGCVVGANSVVTHDLAPYSIAAGTPARTIGKRLSFAPPREINAEVDAQLPYFYAGFRQLADDERGDERAFRLRGGQAAWTTFRIALDVSPQDDVEVEVDAIAPCRIRHGFHGQDVGAGRSILRFAATPDRHGFLEFDHDGAAAEGLVVIAARTLHCGREPIPVDAPSTRRGDSVSYSRTQA